MERVAAIVLLAYVIALLIGEGISEILDGLPEERYIPDFRHLPKSKLKLNCYRRIGLSYYAD